MPTHMSKLSLQLARGSGASFIVMNRDKVAKTPSVQSNQKGAGQVEEESAGGDDSMGRVNSVKCPVTVSGQAFEFSIRAIICKESIFT